MEIILKTTIELDSNEWNSYTTSFNSVFEKSVSLEEFKHKYITTISGYSYHAFLKDQNKVVGGFTIIPYEYYFNDTKYVFGLAVDVFVHFSYRKNPFYLHSMYKKLKKVVERNHMVIVIGVPNDNVYRYWKSLLKWRDIGNIPFYALPVKFGNVISKARIFLNILNWIFLKIWFIKIKKRNHSEQKQSIRINKKNPIVEQHRYTDVYIKKIYNEVFFSYRTVIELGVKASYLIDYYNVKSKLKDEETLKIAVKKILKNESPDIILYIGKISFKQKTLIRVPFKYEPKHLFFTADIIDKQNLASDYIYNYDNWEFGLFNYDVR